MNPVKLMLIDDNPLICDSMTALIEKSTRHLRICGTVMNRTDALPKIRELNPDFCLVDISLNGREAGLELMREIKEEYPAKRVIAVSLHDEDLYAERALMAGADGYLSKADLGRNITKAVDAILSGELFVSGKNGPVIVDDFSRRREEPSL